MDVLGLEAVLHQAIDSEYYDTLFKALPEMYLLLLVQPFSAKDEQEYLHDLPRPLQPLGPTLSLFRCAC